MSVVSENWFWHHVLIMSLFEERSTSGLFVWNSVLFLVVLLEHVFMSVIRSRTSLYRAPNGVPILTYEPNNSKTRKRKQNRKNALDVQRIQYMRARKQKQWKIKTKSNAWKTANIQSIIFHEHPVLLLHASSWSCFV